MKREYNTSKKEEIKIRISKEEKELFKQFCQENNIEMSSLLVNYIRGHISRASAV